MDVQQIISSGLIELYATGMATAEEAIQVEQWIGQYPEVADEYRSIQLALETYALANASAPSSTLKSSLFSNLSIQAEIREDEPSASKNNSNVKVVQMRQRWKWLAAASILLLFGSLILNYLQFNRNKDLHEYLAHAQQNISTIRQSADEQTNTVHQVLNEEAVPVRLLGQDCAPGAGAKVFWMKATGEVFVDPCQLPDAPRGKEYQLWSIVDGKPVSAGMVRTSGKGDKFRIQKMKSFGKVEAFAITLENEQGSETPQGPMLVMGKI